MPFVRCRHYYANGNPINGGCKLGSICPFVHPSLPADWARAPLSYTAMRKKDSSFRPPPKAVKPRWPGSGKPSTAGPSTPNSLSAEASRDASPDDPDSANPFDTGGISRSGWSVSDSGWRTKTSEHRTASPTTTNVFEASKGKAKASRPIAPSESAVAPPPPPSENRKVPQVISPIVSGTPTMNAKFKNAGFINRSELEEREFGEVLSSPVGVVPVKRAPSGSLKPVLLSEVHADSEKFVRQLLDAVFKTRELNEAEVELARTKRLMYSPRYERASHITRLKLESERQLAEQDRFIKDERLRSRLARLAELPNVDAHLAEIAPALEKSNAVFAAYLESVEAWREGLEPYVRGLWEGYKGKVRKREDELAQDERPDWVKSAPQMKGQYDKLVELERSVDEFVLEHENRETQIGQSLMAELTKLAKEGDQRLQEAFERAQQENVDFRMKQMVSERKGRNVELRRQLYGLGEVIGAELDKEVQREPRTSLEDYMASIRDRVRRQHEQHIEHIHTIKTQHIGVDELLKQTEPTPAYDLPKLISEAQSLVERRVDDRISYVISELNKSSESVLSNYENQQVRFLWESSEPIRLVKQYVDSDEEGRNQFRISLQEHVGQPGPERAQVQCSGGSFR